MTRTKKTLLIFFGVFFAVLIFFPQIASVGFGKKIVVKSLERQFHGTLQIDSLSLSWLGPQKIRGLKFSRQDLQGSLKELETPAPLWSISSQFNGPFFIHEGSIAFGSNRIEQINGQILDHDFTLSGITRQANQTGSISAQGKVFSKNQFDVTLNAIHFPTAVLDSFLEMKGSAIDLLGASFNLDGTIANPGKVDLNLISDNGKANLKGKLESNTLTLTDPLNASFLLTEGVSKKWMQDANPLFVTSISSKSPILLRVSPQGFVCSFFPFSLEKLTIGQAVLDLGQTKCRIGKSIASILSLLNAPTSSREINAWFTPLAFKLQGGWLRAGRMDVLLADSIHICTWGDIDLLKSQLHMFLGLPADTLRRAFGIKNLSETFVLKVPISGTTQDPEIEKGAAAAKIAAMVAGQNIPKKGEVFGGLVNQFIQIQEEKGVPPPNRPFPWER